MTALADHAARYAHLGLRICRVRDRDKAPPDPEWPTKATADPDTITTWWTQRPNANIGLALGPQPSGLNLFAIDVDRKPECDGAQQLRQLVTQHGPLPATWTTVSGTRGRHFLFTAPPTVTVRNQQSRGNRIAPGIDVRGDGGYVILPPSIHPTGPMYEWAPNCAPHQLDAAPAPDWLLALVTEPPTPTGPPCPHCGSTNTKGTPS